MTIIIPVLYQRNMGVTMTIFNFQIAKRGEHKEANHVVPQGLQKETDLEILNDQSTENQTRSPRTLCRAVFLFLCILNVVVIFYYIFINVQLLLLLHSIGPSP